MRIKLTIAIAALSVGFASIAFGQGDSAIPARQELMKMNGAAMKAASAMAKGEAPYNEAEAAGAMKIIADDMEEFPGLFPPGSEGGDTKASAKIWEDMDGFKAASAKAVTDARAAEAAASEGLEAFQAALGAVGQNCGGCHKVYRN